MSQRAKQLSNEIMTEARQHHSILGRALYHSNQENMRATIQEMIEKVYEQSNKVARSAADDLTFL